MQNHYYHLQLVDVDLRGVTLQECTALELLRPNEHGPNLVCGRVKATTTSTKGIPSTSITKGNAKGIAWNNMANTDGPRLGRVKQVRAEKRKVCFDLVTDSDLGAELPESLCHLGLDYRLQSVHEMLG